MKKERFKCIVAAHIFVIRNDNILLLRRYNTGYEDGKYSVLAGHIDGNESAIEAAQREALEEGGISISKENLKFIGVMHRKAEEERIDFFFEAEKWFGEIQNIEPDKCSELKWYPLNSLPSNMIPYIREAINNYKRNKVFSTYGF